VATEDRRFYSHPGFDVVAVGRVVTAWLRGAGDQGGATLDQQLAKRLYTSGSAGVPAEVEQVVLGVKLDQRYSKDQILSMYLDAAYYGNGFYGLEAAAEGYFRSTADRLTWGQASMLAGVVQAPTAYDPLVHLDLARSRQRHVLDRLVSVGTLSAPEAAAAYDAPLGLASGRAA
jgi:penicillin-binding protein 1A